MAEIIQRTGTWTFDGETVRIVPATEMHVHPLRKALGEVAAPPPQRFAWEVPPHGAVRHRWGNLPRAKHCGGEPGRKGGRLRLRLREGADPLAQVASGRLPDASDPYQLPVERDRTGVAEYFVDEVRHALLLDQIPDTPCDRHLLPGPPPLRSARGRRPQCR